MNLYKDMGELIYMLHYYHSAPENEYLYSAPENEYLYSITCKFKYY